MSLDRGSCFPGFHDDVGGGLPFHEGLGETDSGVGAGVSRS